MAEIKTGQANFLSNLNLFRQFYLIYPQIIQTVSEQLKKEIIQAVPGQLQKPILWALSEKSYGTIDRKMSEPGFPGLKDYQDLKQRGKPLMIKGSRPETKPVPACLV